MQITEKAVEAVKVNIDCIARLMILFKKSQSTITRMLDDKNILLTTPAAVKIITEFSGLQQSEVLEGSAELAPTG